MLKRPAAKLLLELFQVTQSTAPRRRIERRPLAVEQQEGDEDKVFMAVPENKVCPVCGDCFGQGTTESFMRRHINLHFSDEESDPGVR